jgi:hypothetical protein
MAEPMRGLPRERGASCEHGRDYAECSECQVENALDQEPQPHVTRSRKDPDE